MENNKEVKNAEATTEPSRSTAVIGTLSGLNAYKINIPQCWTHGGDNANNFKYKEHSFKYLSRDGISELIQKKAFLLGYSWGNKKEVHMDYCQYLFFSTDGRIYHTYDLTTNEESSEYYNKHGYNEISWKDFLRLPEPTA